MLLATDGPVFARWSKWLVVFALILMVGAHWAFLQSAAWVGMAVSFSKQGSFSTALEKTFDGKHPCKLCQFVKTGKDSEQKRELQKLETKFEFLTVAGTCGLVPPRPSRLFVSLSERAEASRAAPLLAPPRAA